MNNALLTIHIASALTAIILSFLRVIVVLAGRSSHDKLRKPVYGVLAVTILSGIALAIMSGGSLAAVCVKGLALFVIIVAIDRFIWRTARERALI